MIYSLHPLDSQVRSSCTLYLTFKLVVGHYYHLVGEILLGVWRVWSNLALRSGLSSPPKFKVASFVQAYSSLDQPEGFNHTDALPWANVMWEDMEGIGRKILDALK